MNAARRTGATSLGTLAAFGAAFISVHVLAPQWARSAGLDVWRYPGAVQRQQFEDERAIEIESGFDRLTQQIAAGDAIAAALIEGRLTLAAAADQVADINRDRPGFTDALNTQFPAARTQRERFELYLLAKVSLQLADEPSHREEVLARIQSQRCASVE